MEEWLKELEELLRAGKLSSALQVYDRRATPHAGAPNASDKRAALKLLDRPSVSSLLQSWQADPARQQVATLALKYIEQDGAKQLQLAAWLCYNNFMLNATNLTVAPLDRRDLSAAVALVAAQEERQFALDNRLERPHPLSQIISQLEQHFADRRNPPLAVYADEQVRGYFTPGVFEFSPNNEMLAFFSQRNGVARFIALPDPSDEDAAAVARLIFAHLRQYWQEQQVLGEMMAWPSRDEWVHVLLREANFYPDSNLAYRPLGPLPPSSRPPNPDLHTRLAHPEDEDALVALHLGEIEFHAQHIPFVKMVPSLEPEFRHRLARAWTGEDAEDGAPLVVVVERAGEVLAMSENFLEKTPGWGGLSRFRPGRFGYLNSVGVRADMRGQGVGRVLVQGVFEAFRGHNIDAYGLWFNIDNPLSSKFWPHLGFLPLWTTYQRRHDQR